MDALIIVDVQNDFCPGGALAVPLGEEVMEPVTRLAVSAPFVVATRDWHPPDHGSFAPFGGPWPVHCVQGTPGAELHPGLDRSLIDVVLDKGGDREREGYSGFEDTGLDTLLRDRRVPGVQVVGMPLQALSSSRPSRAAR